MMKRFLVIGLVVSAFLVACNKVDNGCKEEKYASAIVNSFPDSLQAGVMHDITVEYVIENSCGNFVELEESMSDDTVFVKVKTLYEGCNCTLEFTEEQQVLSIGQDSAGYYYYKFWIADSDYDVFSLVIYD